MSTLKNKMINQYNLPKGGPFLADDQQQSHRPLYGKWDVPQHNADLERRKLIRESEKLRIQTASDVVAKPKKWIFPEWLPQGELTVLAGPPGTGKTALECALAAGVTQGNNYSLAPGLTPTRAGHVIVFNTEDDIETSLKPRLEAAGADLTRVHFIECNAGVGEDSPFSFSRERDVARLLGRAELLGNNLALIIIDPIYFAVDGDSNNNFKAREAYERLASLAKRLTCAILGIAHTAKITRKKDPLNRVSGPPALREVPRAVMLLSKISNGPTATGGTHVLVHAKNSEGKMDGGLEYRIKTVEFPGQHGTIETTKFVVTAALSGSPDDILNEADKGMPVKSLPVISLLKRDIAVEFLRGVLEGGPRLWIDVEKLADEAGVSKGTLMNAKTFLKIVTKKSKGDGRSVWRLPDEQEADNPMD